MSARVQVLKVLALAAPIAAAGAAANAGGYNAPVVEPVVAPIVEATPVGDWAGAYGGLTLGYAFKGQDRVGVNEDGPGMTNLKKLELNGVNGGIRAGYRWQKDRWVFGPELGFEGGKIEDSFTDQGYDAESKIKNVLALRFKTGYEVNPETLVYGIAGVARAKVDYKVEGPGADINDSFSRTGYVVGLGVERKLTERMSITGEYEYANFGKESLEDAAGTVTKATAKYNNVKVGLNFKF